MGLRQVAAADLRTIIEDSSGFGWAVTVTDPEGNAVGLTGLSADIHQTIDPETGQAVSGRKASVTFATVSLLASLLGIPVGVADSARRPWVIRFDDINGYPHTFKVLEALQDRAAGCVVCVLEAYKPNAPNPAWPPGS